MVWVWPPHTSMNLKWSAPSPVPAKCSIATTSLRAAVGSRNSSTNFMSFPAPSDDRRRIEGFYFGGVGVAELLDGRQREQRFGLVDLGHREAHVHQHPVVGFGHLVFQQPHRNGALHTVDVDLRQIIFSVGDLDDPPRDSQTHFAFSSFLVTRCARLRRARDRHVLSQQILGSGSPTSMSTIREPPNPVRRTTVSAGSGTICPTSAASAPNGCDRIAASPASASSGATTAMNLPSLAT